MPHPTPAAPCAPLRSTPPLSVAPPSTPRALPGLVPVAAALPLHGVTILVVEDSRFAAEAMRLMCQRSGARLRRVETMTAARRHLSLYRPDALIVDLGLPDGYGEALIGEIAAARPRPALILGWSGDPAGRGAALAAGADGFLDKPVASLDQFRSLLAPLARGTGDGTGAGTGGDLPLPDPLALRDDLARAAQLAAGRPEGADRRYLCGFLTGIARHADDPVLAEAARSAQDGEGIGDLSALLSHRLKAPDAAFAARLTAKARSSGT